jgi:hypothetical protein
VTLEAFMLDQLSVKGLPTVPDVAEAETLRLGAGEAPTQTDPFHVEDPGQSPDRESIAVKVPPGPVAVKVQLAGP